MSRCISNWKMEDFPYIAMLVFRRGIFSNKLNTLDIQTPPEVRYLDPPKNIPKTTTKPPPALLDVGKVIQLTDGWQGISQGIHVPDSSVEEVAAVVSRVVVRWGCWKWACGFSGFRCCWSFFWIWEGGMKILIDLSNLRIFDQIAIERDLLFLKHRMDPYF